MAKLGMLLLAGFLAAPFGVGPTDALCDPAGPPTKKSGVLRTTDYQFHYESDVGEDPKESSNWCYKRTITNRHPKNNLRYDWKTAGLANYALPPSETDSKEFNSSLSYQEKPDAILIGVERRPERVRVFVETLKSGMSSSPKSPSSSVFPPLRSRVRITTLSTKGEKLVLELSTESTATFLTSNAKWGYEYRAVRRQGFGDVLVTWRPIVGDPIISEHAQLSPFGVLQVRADPTSSAPPLAIQSEFRIFDFARTLRAQFTVPVYVPSSSR